MSRLLSQAADHIEHNAIYAALYMNDIAKSWRWSIYLHRPNKSHSGFRLQITDARSPGSGQWEYTISPHSALQSSTISTLVKIGQVADPSWGVEFLDVYLRPIQLGVVPAADRQREHVFDERVWFREAVRRLRDAGMFLACPDVDALEMELMSYARLGDQLMHPTFSVSKRAWPFSL
ncbi:hypothetical protein SISSUDRAFT_70305 [Sistotremastrum suecicum HHB10207 ss-3]|uniref:Uncharacterized protein n=1 Tax=Sistotremastrum suecicum HHB10207 ss-3 TaxID=1314776 RepID=A0A166BH37_9AGAM|nr:hypothetical protein SISSUDRAFT_70305 [Sistotremastrum suecicum HHB10207 ss-3]